MTRFERKSDTSGECFLLVKIKEKLLKVLERYQTASTRSESTRDL
jgi:hypothetical protein